MATKFQIKRTSVSGRTPNTTNSANSSYIAAGELALNLTDKKMYSSNGTNYFEIGAFKVQLVNSTSNVSTFSEISTLQFDEDSGFDITNPSTGVAKVAMNSTFKFWQVNGTTQLTATGLDTVNFIAGNNITITANGANTPQSIAFSTSLTPTFISATFGNSTVNTVVNSTSVTVKQLYANGSFGSINQILTSNGTGMYWSDKADSTFTITSETFTANGTATTFTLSQPTTSLETFVFLNGVAQVPVTDYSISNVTLTFVAPPANNDEVEVRIIDIPQITGIDIKLDAFVGNGSNTVYTLSTSLSSNTTTFVYLNGVAQVPAVDYSVSGSTLTFTTAPVNSELIRAVTINPVGNYASDSFTANSTVNNSFTLSIPTVTNRALVFINGVAQAPSVDYYVSGTTLKLTNNAAANDVVQVRSFFEEPSGSGPNTTIQYNYSGRLKGSLGFTFDETSNNVIISNTLTVPNFILNASNPPANSTATGSTGTFAWDSSYFYIATGTNTWKKVPITTDGVVGSAVTAGSNTEIQFNDSGALGANSNFTFNKTSGLLTVGNSTVNTTVNSSAIVATKIIANGAFGSNGQVLTSNGTAMYWDVGGGAGSGVGITRESFTGNGSNTIFTLSTEPIDETHLMVYVDRVIQRDADYNVSGTTLSFLVAPDNGAEIDAYIMTDANQQPKGVKVNSFTGNGSNTQFTLGAASSNSSYTLVFVDTIFQPTSEYSINGTTITFNSAPDNAVPIEVIQLGTGLVGDPQVAGSNNEIQYHSSNSFAANNKFTFNPSTTTLAVGSNLTINTSAIFIGNSTVNTTIIAGNVDLQGTQLRVGNVVVNGNQLVLGNVTITDAAITVGNSTVNTVLGSTGSLSGNGSQLTSVNAITLQGNSVNDILLAANTAANTLAAAAFTNAASRADSAYSNAIAYSGNAALAFANAALRADAAYTNATSFASNADNISSGTLNTARLPATVNVATAVNVGANLNINTSTVFVGNSTVNTSITAGGIVINGVNVNTAITSNAATAYSNATSYADTKAGEAFSNAASRADSAYSNAVAYAASNSYVNSTFLPLAGGTMTGSLTVNATANIVANLSANNVTIRGNVQIDGNLVVSGTSVTLNVASFAVEDNMLHLNNGATETHPDLGLAGNYNDGTYKHAGIFRDATDGVWKVFDGYTPEPNTAFIDTSNASFRIADFTANVVTAASINVVSGALTTIAAGNTTITGFANVIGVSNTDGLRVVRNAGVTSQYIELNTNASAAYVTFNSSASNPKDVYYDIPPANNTSDIFHMFRVSALDKLKVNTSVVTVNAQLSAGNTTITGLANVSGNVTVSDSYLFVGQDVRSNGQIRATGWYNAPSSSRDGPAIEIGISTHGYILSYDRDTSAYRRMYFNANSFYIQTQGTQDGTYIGNSGSTHAYFASNGNVGIGTTTPGNRFVVGTESGVSSASIVAVLTTGNLGNCIEFGHSNPAGYRSTLGAFYGGGQPFLAFHAEAGTTNNTFRTRGIAGSVLTTDNAGALLFSRVTTASADNQSLTESMRITANGNVGVGTTTANEKLTVNGSIELNKLLIKTAATEEAGPLSSDAAASEFVCVVQTTAYYAAVYPGTIIYETNCTSGYTTVKVNKTTTPTYGSFTANSGFIYSSNMPIHLLGSNGGTHHALIPLAHSSSTFVHHSNRSTPITFFIYSPFGTANVSLYTNTANGILGAVETSNSVPLNGIATLSTSTTGYHYIKSTNPIVVSASGIDSDRTTLKPPSRVVYNRSLTGANTIYGSLSTVQYANSVFANGVATSSVSVGYSDQPLQIVTIADGSGGDAAQGMGLEYLSDTYSYGGPLSDFVIITPYANTIVNVSYFSSSTNAWVVWDTISITNGSIKAPGYAARDGTNGPGIEATNISGIQTNMASGNTLWSFSGSKPFGVWVNDEYDDETALIGWNSKNVALKKQIPDVVYQSANGNVGIGTSAPRGKLDVYGLNSEAYFGNGGDQGLVISNTRRSNYGDLLVAKNLAGNSSSDNYRTIATSAATGYAGIEFKYGGEIALLAAGGATTADAIVTPTTRMYISGGGNITLNGRTTVKDPNNADTSYPFAIQNGSQQPWYLRAHTTSNDFALHLNGAGDLFRIGANGNVGIGTTSPASALVVNQTVDSGTARIDLQNTGAGGSTDYSEFRLLSTAGTARTAVFRMRNNIEASIGSVTNDPFTFITNNTERVRITAAGDVGIGTTSPAAKLQVVGDFIFGTNSAYTNLRFFTDTPIGSYNQTNAITPLTTPGSGTATTALYLKNAVSGPGTNRIDLLVDGNVGIGTTSPTGKLNVYVDADTNISIGEHPSYGAYNAIWTPSNDYVLLWQNGGHTFLNSRGSGDIFFREDNNTLMTILNGGNVGIGTTSPSTKLDVSGTITCTTLTETSSITFKENVDPITNALDSIVKLVGVTYDRKDGSAKNRAGLIAEEVEQVLPNVVQKDSDGNPSGIQYTNLIAYLVESIKELKQEIDILKGK